MKKSTIIGIVILLALVGFIVSQKGDSTINQEKQNNKVATTIFPLYDMTKQIAGDEFEVVLILPSGSSPHTFDPQPSLLKELQGSQAIFAIGHGLDNWATTIARSIDSPIITLDDDVNLRATVEEHEEHSDEEDTHDDHEEESGHKDDHMDGVHDDHDDEEGHDDEHYDEDHDDHNDEDQEEHEGHDHGPIDPHYWLSLHNAEQITMNIAYELSELDVENTDLYMNRAKVYIQKIEALEIELKGKTQALLNNNIISLHDAWYYFAEEFDLNLVGTFEPSAGKEPTPQYIANLEHEVEEHSVSTLFMEPQLSQSSVQAFANDHDLGIAVIDPLGGAEGRNSYLELMRYNVEQVVAALNN
ncbi:MAG: zinc transport system substrate-binding protein [Candidatus Paceibacteria bacterium]|jgi:zinc transport system substrate-binding protein